MVSINENIKVKIYSNTKSWHYCLFERKVTRLLFLFFFYNLLDVVTEMYINIKTFTTFFFIGEHKWYGTEDLGEKFILVISSIDFNGY